MVEAQKWRLARVLVRQGRGFAFQGSGFILVRAQRSFIMTNRHIVEQARTRLGSTVEIWASPAFAPKRAHPAEILTADEVADLAILGLGKGVEIEGQARERVGVGKVGGEVFVMGYDDQHMDVPVLSRGTIVRVGPFVARDSLFVISGSGSTATALLIEGASCPQGRSGSPVFDLVGRIVAYVKGHDDKGRCFAISIDEALRRLQRVVAP
ncbi:MAG: trypsin-like peptidase domain-containing protein [Armatimonadetes bacterium]|nr:trypsin-like peptidase domain-containing protein [Armatimonadota bacterium]